jgi:hypothetical protein
MQGNHCKDQRDNFQIKVDQMHYKIIREKSENSNELVWVLKSVSHPNLYKEVAMGERAEFPDKKEAEDYLKEVEEPLKQADGQMKLFHYVKSR